MNKISMLLLAVMALVTTSCLKDEEIDDQKYGMKGIEDIKLVEITGAPRKTVTLAVSPTDTTFTAFMVRLNEAAPASEDVQVTLALNNDTVSAVGLAVAPATAYSLESTTVTIPKGEREAPVRLKVSSSAIADDTYGVGVSIQSASNPSYNVSRNYSTIVVALPVKNKYDGIYSVLSGTVTRYLNPTTPANNALSGPLAGNPDVTLSTITTNTVEITGLQWAAGNNSGVAGIDNLRATIDPATNLVTMQALGNATLANSPGKENRYDPATQTFYFSFKWNPTANVREYEVVLKYKKPR